IHAVKPRQDNEIPQAATAHDSAWDFFSQQPSSMHTLFWAMSGHGTVRSYRHMDGWGVHTFRFVADEGKTKLVKFRFKTQQGLASRLWEEQQVMAGKSADADRQDLWEAIEAGEFPQWELGLQIFTEEQAEAFPFDVLDPTKIVPEELVPVVRVGKMTLNRNPDNFFAETEQVAFCTAHIVPGIDFSNDPLLQGRIHSYLDTQLTRLGGPNFHEIPINSSIAPVNNNQRDGMHRQAIHRGRVSYEPNSLAGGCPFQAGISGFSSFPQPIAEDKVRGKPELFADHYSQATLFWQSQTPVEKAHIIAAFRFELTRIQVVAIRQRVLSLLLNVDKELATSVAKGLGLELPPAAHIVSNLPAPTYEPSPALSLFSRPGQTGIHTRRVAILVGNEVEADAVATVYTDLLSEGAVPRIVGVQLGKVITHDGKALDVEISLEAGPSVLYDAVIVAGGDGSVKELLADAHALEFVRLQYRHCKPIMAIGSGVTLLHKADVPTTLPDGSVDEAIILVDDSTLEDGLSNFKKALAAHRFFTRELDPPIA
ncbi:MAG: catalase, partial [Sphingobacteriales bacterium]